MCRLLSTLLLGFVFNTSWSQKIVVGTYNIRLQTTADSGNLWAQRAPMVAALVRFHDFDVFGTQEGFLNQLEDIKKSLPEFDFYGAGRDDGKQKGEHSAIFFRKDRFNLLNKGDFWLSQTPDQPSLGWDAKCCFRICTWVYLEDKKTHKRFYYFSAHYDHEGVKARLESSKLVLQRMQSICGSSPAIFCGDLNCDQQSDPYKAIINSGYLADSFRKTNFPYAANGTFNNYGTNLANTAIIDHVFVTDHFIVSKWGILSDSYYGKYPSDHFPVMTILSFK
ncbi:MAG: endonuclease/exonuclease/phosphatase family protein [Chitinophagaceae bacterium]|nr:endonuclease/exonuclease/phosphatase family protein [Chitinophagaceae bacterium]